MTPRQTLNVFFPPAKQRPHQQRADAVDLAIQKGISQLADGLTQPDDKQRQACLQHVLKNCMPEVHALLIDRMVGRLADASEGTRRPILASLADFGSRALPALTIQFARTRNAAFQQGVLAALRGIVPRLNHQQRLDLMTDGMILTAQAADESVRRAIGALSAALRTARDVANRPKAQKTANQ